MALVYIMLPSLTRKELLRTEPRRERRSHMSKAHAYPIRLLEGEDLVNAKDYLTRTFPVIFQHLVCVRI